MRILKMIIIVGWISGAFPLSTPFRTYINYKFKWLSFSVFYWLFSLSFILLVAIEFICSNGAIHYDNPENLGLETRQLSVQIMSWIVWLGPITYNVIIRVNMLIYAKEAIGLIQCVHVLGSRQCELLAKLWKFSGEKYREKNPEYVWYFVTMVPDLFLWYHEIHQDVGFSQFVRLDIFKSLFFPEGSQVLVIVMHNISDFLQRLATHFATWFFIVIGIRLIKVCRDFGNILESQWKLSHRDIMIETSLLQSSIEMFSMIQKSVDSFNSVCGMNMLFLVLSYTLAIVGSLYGLQVEGSHLEVAGLIGSTLIILTLCAFGHAWETRIRKTKNRLVTLLVLRKPLIGCTDFYHEKLTEVTQWFLQWECALTAKGVFPLNNSLIPLVLSSGVTYIIFIFQLKASEY